MENRIRWNVLQVTDVLTSQVKIFRFIRGSLVDDDVGLQTDTIRRSFIMKPQNCDVKTWL